MDVEVIIANPPMIEEIDRVFHVRGKPVLFCWGTKVYNPRGVDVPSEIVQHEAVHSGQQTDWTGRHDEDKVRAWWTRYLEEPAFRLDQEVAAHKAEYSHLAGKTQDREMRHRYLRHVAAKLAAPLYGSLVTPREATRLITGARR